MFQVPFPVDLRGCDPLYLRANLLGGKPRFPQEQEDHPALGRILSFDTLVGNWVFSPWFGFLELSYLGEPGTYFYHYLIGHVRYDGGGPAGLWLSSGEHGMFWTSAVHYPNVFLISENRWDVIGCP